MWAVTFWAIEPNIVFSAHGFSLLLSCYAVSRFLDHLSLNQKRLVRKKETLITVVPFSRASLRKIVLRFCENFSRRS
jgi:hypothetical protein